MTNIKEIDDPKLQEAIARFESIHGAIEEICPQFVGAIVEFTEEGLKDEDNFTDWQGIVETDNSAKAATLLNQIYENGLPAKYQDEYDRIESTLHPIVEGDEIDALVEEIVRAIVQTQHLTEQKQ